VNAPHCTDGTQVALEIDGVMTPAIVVEMPFLDPAGNRMRA
jgi:glycine cleavage system aminomethyltransferase T